MGEFAGDTLVMMLSVVCVRLTVKKTWCELYLPQYVYTHCTKKTRQYSVTKSFETSAELVAMATVALSVDLSALDA